MLWMIFLSIEKLSVSCVCFECFFLSIGTCQSRVYALNGFFVIDRKMPVSCVSFIDRNMSVSCVFFLSIKDAMFVCMLWMSFLSIEECQSRVYVLNDFSIDRKNMSVSCVSFIDRKMWDSCDLFLSIKKPSFVCMLWMVFSIDRKNQSRVYLRPMKKCESHVHCLSINKCHFRVYALSGGFLFIEKCQSRVYALSGLFYR